MTTVWLDPAHFFRRIDRVRSYTTATRLNIILTKTATAIKAIRNQGVPQGRNWRKDNISPNYAKVTHGAIMLLRRLKPLMLPLFFARPLDSKGLIIIMALKAVTVDRMKTYSNSITTLKDREFNDILWQQRQRRRREKLFWTVLTAQLLNSPLRFSVLVVSLFNKFFAVKL